MSLQEASRQWASRPDDQRFTSLDSLYEFARNQKEQSRSLAISSRRIEARPIAEDETRRSLVVIGPDGQPSLPTNWAFGQLAARISAPAGYLRTLPSDIAADAINYGLRQRNAEDVGALLRVGEGVPELAALTGPNYGRVWNADVVKAIGDRFGNGIDGDFTVPGEFGKAVEVNKSNTTLYASDRDCFIFLADEKNRIEFPNRRNGQPGSLARGFYAWNSEVGSQTLGIACFFFDYACSNRTIWGGTGFEEVRVRHTVSAPDRFIEEVTPAIESYANSSAAGVVQAIEDARAKRIGDPDAVKEFLAKRFTKSKAEAISLAHFNDENRPIENLWDASVGVTAYARGIKFQDERVALEKEAGKILRLAA